MSSAASHRGGQHGAAMPRGETTPPVAVGSREQRADSRPGSCRENTAGGRTRVLLNSVSSQADGNGAEARGVQRTSDRRPKITSTPHGTGH